MITCQENARTSVVVAHSYNPRIQRLKRKGCYKFKSAWAIEQDTISKRRKNKEKRKIEESRLAALGFRMVGYITEIGHTV